MFIFKMNLFRILYVTFLNNNSERISRIFFDRILNRIYWKRNNLDSFRSLGLLQKNKVDIILWKFFFFFLFLKYFSTSVPDIYL